MKGRLFINCLTILLGVVALTGICFTPVLADEINPATGLSVGEEQEVVIAPENFSDDVDIDEETFGLHYQYTWVSALSFHPTSDIVQYLKTGGYAFTTTPYWGMAAAIRLPSGANLSQTRLYFYDNSSSNIRMNVYRLAAYTSGSTLCSANSSGTPGYSTIACNPNVTIANGGNVYFLGVNFNSVGSNDLKFMGVRLTWGRQINPNALSYQRFSDVAPGHWAYREIQALAAARITTSCGGDTTRFCPDRNVTKAAMATFLARALGLYWAGGSGY